jgi:PAS domain S-box-containing protein
MWVWYAAAGIFAATVLYLVPDGSASWLAIAVGIPISTPIAIHIGIRRNRPSSTRAWHLLLVGFALTAAASSIRYPSQAGFIHRLNFPSIADLFFLSGYLVIFAGLVDLARSRAAQRRRAGFLDAVILGIGVGIASWVFPIRRLLDHSVLSGPAKITAIAYPLLDVLLLVIVARLAFTPGRWTPALRLVGLYAVAQLLADTVWFGDHSPSFASPAYALWICAFVCAGASTLHPSVRTLSQPGAMGSSHSKLRAMVIGIVGLTGPAIVVVDRDLPESPVLGLVMLVLFCLIVVRLSGLMVDIDEYRRKVEELRRAESRFRTLVEQVPTVVYESEFDDEGPWRYLSPRIESVLGFSVDEFFAERHSWSTFIEPADRAAVAAKELTSRETGEPLRCEYRVRHRDGHLVWVRDEAKVVRDADGNPAYFLGILADVSSEKRAEQAIEVQNADLERRVALRTDELREANRDLRAAKEQAERANHAKSELLSRVSHELRTPLNAILGFGQLLQRSALPAHDLARVDQILEAGGHLLGLVDDVLDITEIDSRSVSISIEPVSVADVVSQAMQLVQRDAAERNIDVETEMAETTGFVLANRIRLGQAVGNLLSNAITFNRDGGGVMITSRRSEGMTVISVADTGHGIPAEAMDRLFSPFDRLEVDGSGGGGVGLGLILTKSLVEAMGGTIRVESTPQIGTTVSIALPSAEDPSRDASTGQGGRPSERRGRSGTVLYIDDNLANLELVEEILAHRPDVTTVTATDGRTGIELARETHPDLVLLDLHLPDMGGEEALACLKRDPVTHAIPVVVISADPDFVTIERVRAAGARDYLTKPFDVSLFLRLVDEVIDETPMTPSSRH